MDATIITPTNPAAAKFSPQFRLIEETRLFIGSRNRERSERAEALLAQYLDFLAEGWRAASNSVRI